MRWNADPDGLSTALRELREMNIFCSGSVGNSPTRIRRLTQLPPSTACFTGDPLGAGVSGSPSEFLRR